ncbi:MAG: hypothetical protein LIO74_12155 [Ruminococcus sp.]|nr:hypothetical protein [Ruminococcus sp.]
MNMKTFSEKSAIVPNVAESLLSIFLPAKMVWDTTARSLSYTKRASRIM